MPLDLCNRMLARLHDYPFVLVATTRPGLGRPVGPRRRESTTSSPCISIPSTASRPPISCARCSAATPTKPPSSSCSTQRRQSGSSSRSVVAFVQETRDSDRLHELPATLHGLVGRPARARSRSAHRSLLEDCASSGAGRSDRGPVRRAGRSRRRPPSCSTTSPNAISSVVGTDDFHFKSELIRENRVWNSHQSRAGPPSRGASHRFGSRRAATSGSTRPHSHLATAAELVEELGTVEGVPRDVREQRSTRSCARRSATSWSKRDHVRAAPRPRALTPRAPRNTPTRRTALLGRCARPAYSDATSTTARRRLERARGGSGRGDRTDEANALTCSAKAKRRRVRTTSPKTPSGRHCTSGASSATRRVRPTCLRGARHDPSLPRRARGGGAILYARRSARSARRGIQRGREHGLCRTLAWISFHPRAHIARPRAGFEESCRSLGELGRFAGGLSWAYGLLAFVRSTRAVWKRPPRSPNTSRSKGARREPLGGRDDERPVGERALWSGRNARGAPSAGTKPFELFRDDQRSLGAR